MCNNVSKIKFCTCDIGEARLPNIYYWTLSRFIGFRESDILGKLVIPSEDLGNNITTDIILNILNNYQPFDFNYSPDESDTLNIFLSTIDVRHKYFSLIFKNGKWQVGRNPAFVSSTQEIATGTIEVNPEL